MTASGSNGAALRERWVALGLGAVALWLAAGVIRLGLWKEFTIDEFQYAHAAWLFAQGVLPYRDFFEVHHPLLYQLLSLVYVFGSDDPGRIGAMRVFMLFVSGATLFAAWRVNTGDGRARALLAPIFVLALLPLTQRMTEVRNDPLAFALFFGALAVLYLERPGPRVRAVLAGALLGLACWGSQKVFVYGSVFFAALLADLVWNRGRGRGSLLANPTRFLLGGAGVAGLVAVYLTLSGSWAAWWQWCFAWALEHQSSYEAFSWYQYMQPVLLSYWWIFGLAGVGVVATWRRLLALGADALVHPDQILLASLLSSFVSLAAQQAPYPYSFIPFLVLACVFAARGVAAVLRRVEALGGEGRLSAPFFLIAGGLLLALLLVRAAGHVDKRLERTNTYQRQVLMKIGELTGPEDAAYDNSGGYVSRPHTHFYFYTDNVIREQESERLLREVPREVERVGTVLFLHDLRFKYLPRPLRDFFARNYQRYNGDIWLWGRRYEGAPASFWLLWLPRNGERYTPRPGAKPVFSAFL